MRVIIRADGNREIAMGHIMRCLSVAEALRAAGARVCFVTAGAETEELLTKAGYENHVLGTDFRHMEAELPLFREFCKRQGAELILTDSYFVTDSYMKELGSLAKTAYMDDLGQPVYPVDYLINYNIYGAELPYARWYDEARLRLPQKLLLGCGFAPLRREFGQGIRSRQAENVRDVLISTGGGDKNGVAYKLCRELLTEIEAGKHRGICYHVVCGPFSEQKEQIRALAERAQAFVIHENVTKMSELMEKCDICVSAAGSTMYELCSMALPTVCFYFAENQRRMAECFGEKTEIQNAGNIASQERAVLQRLLQRIGELEADAALRRRIRQQMQQLTDGRGAARLAEELME